MIQEIRPADMPLWKGFCLVALVVAAIKLLSVALSWAQRWIGYAAASVGLWVLGFGIAFLLLRVFVLGYRYELDGEELNIKYLYGRRARFLDRVLLRTAVAYGSLDDMRKRYPQAPVRKAVRKDCNLPALAVVFRSADTKILYLQPDDALKNAIMQAVKAK